MKNSQKYNSSFVRLFSFSYSLLTMNKLKAKFEGVMKSTAMSAQQIYKHKSFNLSKTQEDPEYGFNDIGDIV